MDQLLKFNMLVLFLAFSFMLVWIILGYESLYSGINCCSYRTHLEASEARGVYENSQMLNWEQILSCVSDSEVPVLNGMPNSSFFTPDIHSESFISSHSPKANYSSETLGESQWEGVDNAGSLPAPHLHPRGAIRLGGCDASLGGALLPRLFSTLPFPSFSLHLFFCIF